MHSDPRSSWIRFPGFVLAASVLIACKFGLVFAQENVDEEGGQPWSLSLATRYLSKYTTYGIDLGQDQSAVGIEGGLSHSSGLSFGAQAIDMLGVSGGFQEMTFHLGYSRAISKQTTLSANYAYHAYESDTLNVLASLKNSLSLGAEFELSGATFSASYNLYFGGGTANYIALGASTTGKFHDLTVTPMIIASVASQTVADTLLPKNRGRGKGLGQAKQGSTTTTTITGLTNVSVAVTLSYSLGKGFSTSFIPLYAYSPTDLAARSSQFLWSAALDYSLDF